MVNLSECNLDPFVTETDLKEGNNYLILACDGRKELMVFCGNDMSSVGCVHR
jgi:hypothetical protein